MKKRKLLKDLSQIFAGVAAGALVLFNTVSIPVDYEPDYLKVDDDSYVDMDTAQIWSSVILDKDSQPYQYGEPDSALPAGEHTIAVQLEQSGNDINELMLYYVPNDLFSRHGESATAILNGTADELSGRDIDVRFIERADALDQWLFDAGDAYAHALFENADVISFSMALFAGGELHPFYSAGNLDSAEEIEQADSFWQSTKAIFVMAAGNSGEQWLTDMERPNATHIMRADAFLRIGEARNVGPYLQYVKAHSSRSAPSFVVTNPYDEDFSFPYIRSEEELRQKIEEYLSMPVAGEEEGLTVRDVLDRNIAGRAVNDAYSWFPSWLNPFESTPPYELANPLFWESNFPGKDKLTASPWLQTWNVEAARNAYIEALVSSLEIRGLLEGADENGMVTGLQGTSFATPHAAGMISAMRERYPELSEYDLVAGALLASRPIEDVMQFDMFVPVDFHDNGRGLMHNAYEAGFGLLTAEHYAQTMAGIASYLQAHPELATQERHIDGGTFSFTAPSKITADGMREYTFEVAEDIVALRANLALKFANDNEEVPQIITLINPAGGEVDVSPTFLYNEATEFSLASTDGHFGNHTKGTWTIRVPAEFALESAQLEVNGFQSGGLIDLYMSDVLDLPPVSPDAGADMTHGRRAMPGITTITRDSEAADDLLPPERPYPLPPMPSVPHNRPEPPPPLPPRPPLPPLPDFRP